MIPPPILARIQLRAFTLWVPLVLAWPLILLAIGPAFLLGAILALVEGIHFDAFLRLWPELGRLLCTLPGTLVSFDSPRLHLVVTLY